MDPLLDKLRMSQYDPIEVGKICSELREALAMSRQENAERIDAVLDRQFLLAELYMLLEARVRNLELHSRKELPGIQIGFPVSNTLIDRVGFMTRRINNLENRK